MYNDLIKMINKSLLSKNKQNNIEDNKDPELTISFD